jgi:prepilin-type N-terminal cleavage/methylation domain-containing protein
MWVNAKQKYNQGFTLIETIIYIALFSIVITGGMVATYQIMQGTDAAANKIIIQEEANFLLRKIDWAMTGANTISTTSSPPSLTITKTGPTVLKFDFSSPAGSIRLSKGGGSPSILNSSNIIISNLSFNPVNIGSLHGINTVFTLTTNLNGRNATQTFSTTKYLRK